LTVRAPERLQSERLEYTRIALEDAAGIEALLLDPRVMKTLWPWPVPPSHEELRTGLESKIAHWERHGFGMWVMRDRITGEFVGRGGLQYTDILGVPAVEVGWAVVPERWGQGVATELALQSVEVAFGLLGLRELIAFTLPDNLASRRVMEKAGFTYARDILHVGLPHVLYRRGPRAGPAGPDARLISTSRRPL
jgi:ribosomal-protein-alanine N-acetyltransferase